MRIVFYGEKGGVPMPVFEKPVTKAEMGWV